MIDNNFLVLVNASENGLDFKLPPAEFGDTWFKIMDTCDGVFNARPKSVKAGSVINLEGRTMTILLHKHHPDAPANITQLI
ncbi:MAG: hypothetical protein ABW036_00005, partial [Flavitalea sp.]